MSDPNPTEKTAFQRLVEAVKPRPLTPEQAAVLATVKFPCC
jgi:hypothetical protein